MENEPIKPTQPTEPIAEPIIAPAPVALPVQPVAQQVVEIEKPETLAHKINRTMAFVLIISAITFVLISILAIWEVFGPDAGTVVWRSLGSLGTIALGALIVSIASKLIDEQKRS